MLKNKTILNFKKKESNKNFRTEIYSNRNEELVHLFNISLDIAKGNISELDERVVENIQLEQREQKMQKNV